MARFIFVNLIRSDDITSCQLPSYTIIVTIIYTIIYSKLIMLRLYRLKPGVGTQRERESASEREAKISCKFVN